jgi:gluconolactonase
MAAVCPGGPYADTPLPADTTAKAVQGGFDFIEGPVWFADLDALFFSDIHRFGQPNQAPLNGPKATMHKLAAGVFEDFIDNSSTNGLGIDLGGKIIASTHGTRSVSRFDPVTKERTLVVDAYMGKKFNSPNDVTVRSDGNIYFTDPDYGLSDISELPTAVYRVTPASAVELVDTLDQPNGVSLSPDESKLYVGAGDGKIRSYALAPDGSPGAATDFADVARPDGFAVDCAGNLYVTNGAGVTVLAPDGSELGTIPTLFAANAAFGGPTRTTLYITAAATLYSIELAIPGYPY